MRFVIIVGHYFIWHYGRAIGDLTRIYRGLIPFTFNFFSVPILVNSFFAPWRRLGEDYPEHGVKLFDYFSVFVVNLLMRLTGIIMRSAVIIIGMAFTLLVILSYPIVLIIWLILPFGIVVILFIGFGLLFK